MLVLPTVVGDAKGALEPIRRAASSSTRGFLGPTTCITFRCISMLGPRFLLWATIALVFRGPLAAQVASGERPRKKAFVWSKGVGTVALGGRSR